MKAEEIYRILQNVRRIYRDIAELGAEVGALRNKLEDALVDAEKDRSDFDYRTGLPPEKRQ